MKNFKYFLIVVVFISVAFLLIGVIKSEIQYQSTITTNKPVAETWDVFTNTELMDEWLEGFESIKILSGDATTIGSTYEVTIVQGEKEYVLKETLKEYKEDELYVFTLEDDMIMSTQEVHFKSDGPSNTIVTCKVVAEGKGIIMKSIFALSKSVFQKNNDETYQKFKTLVNEI